MKSKILYLLKYKMFQQAPPKWVKIKDTWKRNRDAQSNGKKHIEFINGMRYILMTEGIDIKDSNIYELMNEFKPYDKEYLDDGSMCICSKNIFEVHTIIHSNGFKVITGSKCVNKINFELGQKMTSNSHCSICGEAVTEKSGYRVILGIRTHGVCFRRLESHNQYMGELNSEPEPKPEPKPKTNYRHLFGYNFRRMQLETETKY